MLTEDQISDLMDALDEGEEAARAECGRLCIANCPKGDKSCMYKCNVAYAKCLKECEE